jgi:hypothetical protein
MKVILLLMAAFLISARLYSQDEVNDEKQMQFFLDCHDCDFTFVRQELPFVSFVRDPKPAQVHILSSSSRTGSGGQRYVLNFIGMNEMKGSNFDYEYFAEQSDSEDDIRRGLLQLLKAGIVQYYSMAGLLSRVDINLSPGENSFVATTIKDRWNLWIFNLEGGTAFEKEANQNEFSLNTEFEVEKVTEAWKTRFEVEYNIYSENYFNDGEKISNRQHDTEVSGDYIKSLNSRWSAGVFSGYNSQTYLNIKNMVYADAGIEYNIFPWDISNRKVFTFRYTAGVNWYDYNEITIYDKLHETLYHESLSLNLRMVQPWGNIESSLEGRHYFHDFSKNRLTLDSNFSIRLSKALSVYWELQAEMVHDQLYLPQGDISLEDLLLQRRKLATDYEFSGEMGIRFTFGSIYSNVVNERF